MWYTTDYGVTYKIAFEFGSRNTTTPAGSWQIRHVHSVFYYEPDDVYIVNTGDSNASECMVFGMRYHYPNDTFTCELIAGPERYYKWTSIALWDGWLYYSWDNSYGEIRRCKYEDIADKEKHEIVLDHMYNDANVILIGQNGDMIATNDCYRNLAGQTLPIPFDILEASRVFYYSNNGKDFNRVIFPVSFLNGHCTIRTYLPTLSDGRIFVSAMPEMGGTKFVSMCLNDILYNAGYRDALLPRL